MAKTISVSDEVHEELTKLGNKGDTFDDIIKRLLVVFKQVHTLNLKEKKQ